MARGSYDVVIVGAGPAGSVAAFALKRQNPRLRVLLTDKAVFPRDKACGDGLGAGAVAALRRLGLLGVVHDAISPLNVRVSGPDGTEATAVGPTVAGRDLSGYVLPREILDARLVAAAREVGVEIREGISYHSSGLTANSRIITFQIGSESSSVEAAPDDRCRWRLFSGTTRSWSRSPG
ncbi:NAD(P)/FAD-dependent oxidoreductase [Frankia sp. CcWB3]